MSGNLSNKFFTTSYLAISTVVLGARTEMRYLKFGLNGNIFGSCEDGHLSGNLELPKIQWMEVGVALAR